VNKCYNSLGFPSEYESNLTYVIYGWILKTLRTKIMGTRGKINTVWWNIKINLQILDMNCQQICKVSGKKTTEVKVFQKVLGGYYLFLETPCTYALCSMSTEP